LGERPLRLGQQSYGGDGVTQALVLLVRGSGYATLRIFWFFESLGARLLSLG
jgi:hypothetical protein